MNFCHFFYVCENTVVEKNWGYKRETISSITWKILVYDMESGYKNIFKIRNITFIFQNLKKKLKNSYGFWKINEFI